MRVYGRCVRHCSNVVAPPLSLVFRSEFESWRDFSQFAEHKIENAEDREEKRCANAVTCFAAQCSGQSRCSRESR